MIDRRSLLTRTVAAVVAGGLAATGLAAPPATPSRLRRIGCTGNTWGDSPDDAPAAIRDVGELGFHGFETSATVLDAWESRGGLATQLQAQGIPLVAAWCPMNLTDPALRDSETLKAARWGALIARYGGRVAVIGPDSVDRRQFDFAANRTAIVNALDNICLAIASAGIKAAVHPRAGSSIMTADEIRTVMEDSHARDVWLCPDTGELLAARVDPLAIIGAWGGRIAHVHVRDYDGGTRRGGFAPLGRGRLNLAPLMDALEALPQEFMVMAELDPDTGAGQADPAAPRRAAEQAKSAFAALGYRFRN